MPHSGNELSSEHAVWRISLVHGPWLERTWLKRDPSKNLGSWISGEVAELLSRTWELNLKSSKHCMMLPHYGGVQEFLKIKRVAATSTLQQWRKNVQVKKWWTVCTAVYIAQTLYCLELCPVLDCIAGWENRNYMPFSSRYDTLLIMLLISAYSNTAAVAWAVGSIRSLCQISSPSRQVFLCRLFPQFLRTVSRFSYHIFETSIHLHLIISQLYFGRQCFGMNEVSSYVLLHLLFHWPRS